MRKYEYIEILPLIVLKEGKATNSMPMKTIIFTVELNKKLNHEREKFLQAVKFVVNEGYVESLRDDNFIKPTVKGDELIMGINVTGVGKEMELEERKEHRYRFLKEVYKNSNGSQSYLFNIADIGKAINLDMNNTRNVAQYLIDEDLIEPMALGGLIRISHNGIKEIEGADENPTNPSTYFPPVSQIINNVNVHGDNSAPLQVGNTNSQQNISNSNINIEDTKHWVKLLEEIIEKENIRNQELSEEIETIKALLSTQKPKDSFVKKSIVTIKDILTGIASEAIKTLILSVPS
ncbi:MAG: hypothetical protein ABUK01_17015 [Leptospirales bacterium]